MTNKKEQEKLFDIGDNFKDDRVVVFARNAVFDIARELGYEYFLVLDDDYTEFRYTRDDKQQYVTKLRRVLNLDRMFKELLEYYKKTNAKTLCIAQGGDFIGGEGSSVFKKKLSRKAMNFFICSVNRPFQFVGRINEDVNTYVRFCTTGDLFLTIPNISLKQTDTQSNKGGMSDIYANQGTYVKSFYSVIRSDIVD